MLCILLAESATREGHDCRCGAHCRQYEISVRMDLLNLVLFNVGTGSVYCLVCTALMIILVNLVQTFLATSPTTTHGGGRGAQGEIDTRVQRHLESTAPEKTDGQIIQTSTNCSEGNRYGHRASHSVVQIQEDPSVHTVEHTDLHRGADREQHTKQHTEMIKPQFPPDAKKTMRGAEVHSARTILSVHSYVGWGLC